jgi:hypothetical protein
LKSGAVIVGIRESLIRNPKTGYIVATTLALVAVAAMTFSLARPTGPRPSNGLAFYSVDDGATWFADASDKPSPFDYQGKPAYRVYVWKCAHGKTFVSHMERLAPAAKKRLDDVKTRPRAAQSGPSVEAETAMLSRDLEVKGPATGDTGWVKPATPEGEKITLLTCPDGGNDVEPVLP